MNNFIQKIKLFYSQNYKEVYDEGELIDVKSLYPSQAWDFEISGLEECSEEEAYLELFVWYSHSLGVANRMALRNATVDDKNRGVYSKNIDF